MDRTELEEFAKKWFEAHADNPYDALRTWSDVGMKVYRPPSPPDLGVHVGDYIEARPTFGGK